MREKSNIVIVGYSGHSYVVLDVLLRNGYVMKGYCDQQAKIHNPYNLDYLGDETSADYTGCKAFISIGNNSTRESVYNNLKNLTDFVSVVARSAVVSNTITMGSGVFIGPSSIINAQAILHTGVIINSGAIVEHECKIGSFSHIAPGAVLAGNVTIGLGSMIGANATIREGVSIGNNVIVGAGCVVLNDIEDSVTVAGNPARIIKTKI